MAFQLWALCEIKKLLQTLPFALMTVVLSSCVFQKASTWKIEGLSMAPTLHDGQIISVEQVDLPKLQRGDIILCEIGQENQIKRLIGLPGETIEVHDGKIFINGEIYNQPYQASQPNYQQYLKLGENEYYILGDNRNNSSDSHLWGPISGEKIKGRVIP